MATQSVNRRDVLCGALFLGIGAYFAWQAVALDIGTARRMGPGFFPLAIAVVLIALGGIVVVGALRSGSGEIGAAAWRGMVLLLPAPILFGLTVRGLGLVPSLFLTCLVAAFASRRMKPLHAVVLSLAVTAFCTAVFSYGIGLPIQRFGPWLQAAPEAVPAPVAE